MVSSTGFRHNVRLEIRGCPITIQRVLNSVTLEDIDDYRPFLTHQHYYSELHYVLEGEGAIYSGQEKFPLVPGQLLLIPPDIPHRLQVKKDLSKLLITFQHDSPPPLDPVARQVHAILRQSEVIGMAVEKNSELERTLNDMCRYFFYTERPPVSFSKDGLRAHATLLMLALLDVLPAHNVPDKVKKDLPFSRQNLWTEDHFSVPRNNPAGATSLSARLNMSTRQLTRNLKDTYGMNYRQKRNSALLDRAISLLADTDFSITRIARELGYSSVTAFGTFIRSQTGISPSRLRREVRSASSSEKGDGFESAAEEEYLDRRE